MHDLLLLVFLDCNYKYEPEACDGCRDISMIAYELENISILNMKRVDYICVIWGMSRSDANNKLNNSKLDDRDLL